MAQEVGNGEYGVIDKGERKRTDNRLEGEIIIYLLFIPLKLLFFLLIPTSIFHQYQLIQKDRLVVLLVRLLVGLLEAIPLVGELIGLLLA